MERHYKAFISYRHLPLDVETARRLHRYIEHFTIPKDLRKNGEKHPGLVFRDQDELPLSGNLSESIQTALDRSEFLIVVCTPETAKSQWVLREITYFIETHGRDHVLAVLAEGNEKTSFPAELTAVTDENGDILKTVEPLAANIAAPGKAKRERLLKTEGLRLMAALIGCNYDDLFKREQRYKRKRILIAASALLLASGAYMTTLAVKNRRITEQNEQITLQNEEITEQYQKISEQNEQISEQLRNTQLNESKNLTALSEIAYEDGDYRTALEYAYQALPKEEDERPFYPEAEAQLSNVLNLYKTDGFVYTQSIGQETAIEGLQLSPDGRKAVTLDSFDCLRIYDCEAGKKLWERKIENIAAFRFSQDGTILACYRYEELFFFDASDGTLLRSETGYHCSGSLISNGVCLLQTGDCEAFFLQDAKSGEMLASVQIPHTDDEQVEAAYSFVISDSGKMIAIPYSAYRYSDRTYTYGILMWDLDAESAERIPLDGVEYGTDVKVAFVGENIAAATADMNVSTLMLFDRAENWQMRYRQEFENEFEISQNGAITMEADIRLFGLCDGYLLFGAGRSICTADPETGDILVKKTLPSSVIRAEIIRGNASLILNDGTVTMYMPGGTLTSEVNMYTFHAGQSVYGGEIRGEHPLTAVYILLFRESKNRLSFIHFLDDRDLPHFYDYNGSRREYSFCISPDRKQMAGIRYSGSEEILSGVLIDISSKETASFSVPMAYDYWSGTKQNDVLLFDSRLYINECMIDLKEQTLSVIDDRAAAVYACYQCRTVYDPDKNDVLTAFLDPEAHTLLYSFPDTDEIAAQPFPESFCSDEASGWDGEYVLECLTSGGSAVISRRNGTFDAGIRQVFLFCPASGSWTELPAESLWFDERMSSQIAAGSESGDMIAALVPDGGITVLRADSGEELLRISCPLSSEAVSQLLFAKEDSLLFVFGNTGTMYLYDIGTGELLHESNYLSSDFRFQKGARCEAVCSGDGRKLVLVYDSDVYTHSFCVILDLEQYASVGSCQGINAYFADTDTLILAPYNGFGLCERPLYTLEEAMAAAEEILSLSE